MTQFYAVKNWEKYQRYHDHEKTGRRMEWLKLFPTLLDDADFCRLSDDSKMMWPMFLILAGITRNRLPFDMEWTRNRLQLSTIRHTKIRKVFMEMISAGFLIPIVSQCGAKLTGSDTIEEKRIRIEEISPPIPPQGAAVGENKNSSKPKFELPDWIPENDWRDFCEMRERMRKPLTVRAKNALVKKLESLKTAGHDISKIIEEAIEKNWLSFYAPKTERAARSNPNGFTPYPPIGG